MNNGERPQFYSNERTLAGVCGVILAGGESRRMGRDKALLPWRGRPVIAHVASALREVASELLLSTNDLSRFAFLSIRSVADRYPGQGPLAGLHAAMVATDCPLLLVAACDMPRIRPCFLRRMIASAEGYDAVVPHDARGRPHPLCAVYRRNWLSCLETCLDHRRNKVLDLLATPGFRVRRLDPADGGFSDLDLINLNRIDDLSRLDADEEGGSQER